MAHSYFFAGEREAGIASALSYAKEELGLSGETNPNIIVFRYGLFSVDDARKVIRLADQGAIGGDAKLIVIAAERLFHEAQNALLKVFEEPPPGTTLVLVVPSIGIILPTLRSRMLALPAGRQGSGDEEESGSDIRAFINARSTEREKMVAKLLERAKSDKDEEKQAARGELLRLTEGLAASAYASWQKKPTEELQLFLRDTERLIPILNERSAPLKLIFEHLLITLPPLAK